MTRTLTKSLILTTVVMSAAAWAQPPGKGGSRQSSGRPVVGTSPMTAPGNYGAPRGGMPAGGYPGSAVPYSSGARHAKRGNSSPMPYGSYPGYTHGSAPPAVSPYNSPWSAAGSPPTTTKGNSKGKSSRSQQPATGYGYPAVPQGMGMQYRAPATGTYQPATSTDSRIRSSKRGTFPGPRTRQSFQPAATAPGAPNMVRPAEGGYSAPGQSPSTLQKQFKSSSDSLKNAMNQGDQERVSEQLYGIRHEAQTLRGRLRTLPLEQRLHVPSISLIYDEGTRLVEDGMRTGQQSKVRMGMEKIEDANRRLGELEKR